MLVCIAPYKPFSADGDPYFDSVIFLHHFDAVANGGQASSWIDVVGNIPALYGSPDITTGKFSGGLSCSAGALSYSGAKYALTGDFTVEAFIFIPSGNFASPGGWDYGTILSLGTYNGGDALQIGADCGTSSIAIFGSVATFKYAPATRNAWHHFAVTRRNGTVSLFVDGAFVTNLATNNTTVFAASHYFAINQNSGYANGGVSNVIVDEVRITNGVSRYRQNDFTDQITGPYSVERDPYFDKVKLLASMDTDFTDVANVGRGISSYGTPYIETPPADAIGTNMAVFAGANNGSTHSFSPSVDFSFGNGDFTKEFWLQPEDSGSVASAAIGVLSNSNSATFTTNCWGLFFYGPSNSVVAQQKRIAFLIYNYSANTPAIVSADFFDSTKLAHVAITRKEKVISLWINGKFQGSVMTTALLDAGNAYANYYYVGGVSYGSQNGRFLIDELRVTKGLSRYSTDIQRITARLPASEPLFEKVKALLRMSDMTSLASNGLGLASVVGSTSFINDAPFGGQSMSFNGALGVATLPSEEFAINGTVDFCIECITKPGAQTNANAAILSNYQSASAGWAAGNWSVQYRADGMFRLWAYNYSTSAPLLITEVMPSGVWYHVAVTRRKVNDTYQFSMFINGVLKAQLNTTTAISLAPASAPVLAVGKIDSTTGFYIGLVNDVRLTVGDCRYYNDFTPSAVAFDSSDPDYDKVVLHCHYDGNMNDEKLHGYTAAGTQGLGISFAKTDLNAKNNVCTYLDGTTLLNTVAHPGYTAGTADFTIEIDVCPQTTGADCYIIGNAPGVPAANNWKLFYNHSSGATCFSFTCFNVSGTTYPCLYSQSPVKFGQWQHVAVVRNGINLYMFVDGVLEAWTRMGPTITLDGAAAGTIYVGATTNGKVANAKLSKVARYIPTFALPTVAYDETNKDWADTVVLNHFDQQTVVAPFFDEKGHAFTVLNAAITCSPSLLKFGNASMYCDGVANHGITTPYSTDWSIFDTAVSTGTIEFNFNMTSYSSTTVYDICGQSNGGGATKKWLLGFNASATGSNVPNTVHLMLSDLVGGTLTGGVCSWPFTPIVGQWYHFALTKNGTNYTLFINGVSRGTQVSTLVPANTTTLYIGCDPESWRAFPGYIDELRFSKTVRYTADFTPSDIPFVSDADTGILLHFNASAINSAVGRPFFSNNAAIALSTAKSKFGSASLKGSGALLQYAYQKFYADTELYGIGKSFAMDMWIYMDTVPTVVSTIVAQDVGAYNNNKMLLALNADTSGAYLANRLCLQIQTGADVQRVSGSFTWAAATWTHIAVVKNGQHYTLFVNNVPIAGATITLTPSVIADFTLGADAEGWKAFNGYIDEFRITRKAVYPQTGGNFTPPVTLDLTTDPYFSNVLFTAKMDKLEFSNRTSPAVSGTLAFSTAIKKFGASSLSFNNASYYTFGPRQDFSLALSDFTMEAWVYLNAYNANSSGLLTAAQTLSANTWRWSILSTGELNLAVGNFSTSAQLVTTVAKVPQNKWAHLAVVRSGSTFTLFINGIAGATASFAGALDAGAIASMLVGIAGGAGYLNGYIGEVSVNASARYTADFIPPTNRVGILSDSRFYITGDTSEGAGATQLDLVLHPFPWSATSGNPCLSSNVPAKYGKAATLDGGSSIVYDNQDILFGTQDFCMDFWCYPVSRRSYDPVIFGNSETWAANAWALWADHHSYRSKFTFFAYNASASAPVITSTTNIKYGQWQHLAITRSGNTWQLLINGIPDASGSSAASLDGLVAKAIRLGRFGIVGQSNFLIDDFRITVGTSRYQLLDVNKPFVDY